MGKSNSKRVSYTRLHWLWIGVILCLILFGKLSRLEAELMQLAVLVLMTFLIGSAVRGSSSVVAGERGRRIATRYSFAAAIYGSMMSIGSIGLAAEAYPGFELIVPTVLALTLCFFWIAALGWIRGHTAGPLVLFLRKFGNPELNAAVKRVFHRKLGRQRYRLITLDDGFVEHSAASTVPVWMTAASVVVLLVFSVVGGYVAYSTYKGAVAESRLDAFALLGAFVMVAFVLVAAVLALLVVLTRYQIASGRSALRSITSHIELRDVLSSLASARTGSVTGLTIPRALVITSTHSMWQESVLAFMSEAYLVLLDVSTSSESIRWELNQVKTRCAGKAVLLTTGESEFATATNDRVLPLITYDSYVALVGKLRNVCLDSTFLGHTPLNAQSRNAPDRQQPASPPVVGG